ncbi:MAG TPA: PilZ domain-containing protein [Persephonella sp.]|uniref:Type IV pilus assembly protein PilZ n=1 Tax=Persephonella marina (strain DSM 14350 / EX-H1) TaxID=123214 RepID=C0QQ45_PERMH|nr:MULTISPECIES: PilZ domain-containing protein [Persephonella]ACO03219.1 type IV pilus assembly protein PilZ [Persephonella marina EX-H1]HCB69594.1 PilZ domain-containing protein [Persephonella sp.]
MEKKVKDLWEKLSDENDFFAAYQGVFADNFASLMKSNIKLKIPETALKKLGNDIYKTLFIVKKQPEKELYHLSLKMYQTKTEIKSVLSKLFMIMIKDFIDHLVEKSDDINPVKTLISLIDLYIQSIERANMDYINSLENTIEKIKKEKQEVEENEIILLLETSPDRVSIIDYFYEVPVICKSKLKSIHKNEAVFNVKHCIFKIFEPGHYVFIRIGDLSKPIKALIKDINYQHGILTLTEFSFSEIPQEKRKFVRVRVKDKILITLQKGSKTIEGFIDDISVGGIGVFTVMIDDLQVGDKLHISFILNNKDFDVMGEIKYITQLEDMYRIGIQFLDLSVKHEDIIGEFVMKRQFEILKKLREL